MENRPRDCLRRIARHDEPVFSNQSIMNVMEKFVKSVNNMNETILVPCRLMDMKVGDAYDTVSVKHSNRQVIQSSMFADDDLFSLYNMINSVKNELLWSQKSVVEPESLSTPSVTKGHTRCPSTVSIASTNSVASSISDTDSDAGNEADSGIDAEEEVEPVKDYARQVAENFRLHLHGLYQSLELMTETAAYLTTRYQHQVGGVV